METSMPRPLTDARRREELARASRDSPSWTLTTRQLGDLELILSGAYRPLDGFMTRTDADACIRERRLGDGSPFPVPVLLDVTAECAAAAAAAGRLVLRDEEGVALAVLDIVDSWEDGSCFVGGRLNALQLPDHHDVAHVRWDVAGLTREIARRGWSAAVAFPTRGVIHRAENAATRGAVESEQVGLVIMALSDPAEEIHDRVLRVRCLQAVLPHYPPQRALVWLVPLPRRADTHDDAALAMLVARNAGCTGVILTEQFGPESTRAVFQFAHRLDLRMVHTPTDRTTEARAHAVGERLPEWYTFPEVAARLATRYPATRQSGFTVFFTGLSGSGKSTIANLVRTKLVERTERPVTLLDGDVVRRHLSSELGFSREHRDLNIRRIAFVAAEITRHGGMAICAPIAPYDAVRREARRAIEAAGGFVLVFVDTPLATCEARDRKGLYAKARAGLIREFTGISDPYERPSDAEVVIGTAEESPNAAAERIMAYLEQRGFLSAASDAWPR